MYAGLLDIVPGSFALERLDTLVVVLTHAYGLHKSRLFLEAKIYFIFFKVAFVVKLLTHLYKMLWNSQLFCDFIIFLKQIF